MSEPQTLSDGEYQVEGDDIRLDRALRERFADSSWNALRRAIRSGKIQVDGATVREPSKQLPRGARIAIKMATPQRSTRPRAALPDDAIVFADAHLVVAVKPAGMPSVPDEQHRRGTFADLLAAKLSRGRKSFALGVVQRLDASTSGLLVFTRTREALASLKEQFKEHTVRRYYVALVAGQAQTTSYSSYLTEHSDGKRKSTAHAHLGKYARTHVEVLERFADATLIRCQLDTGRTHQIRIHLSEAGHPLLGDRRYARHYIKAPEAPRLMLHAAALGFEHPSGDPMEFEQPPPADFQKMLSELRHQPAPRS